MINENLTRALEIFIAILQISLKHLFNWKIFHILRKRKQYQTSVPAQVWSTVFLYIYLGIHLEYSLHFNYSIMILYLSWEISKYRQNTVF